MAWADVAARYLRVLLIDDDQALSFEDEARGDSQRQIVAPLEQIKWHRRGQVSYGIDSLAGAVDYWTAFSSDLMPDIVLSDLNFEKDSSTPLQHWGAAGQMNRIPTGLSHCKPFAAIARANARAIAIVIFTQDASIWARLLEAPRTPASIFGLLAAHEIYELSGILGEGLPEIGGQNYDAAWAWLNRHHEVGLQNATQKAVESLREQIVRGLQASRNGAERVTFLIPYTAANELRVWCAAMAENPEVLGPKGSDPGLTLVQSDGRIDRIYLSSLFADIRLIERQPLPRACYQVQEGAGDLWALVNGLPRIGNLIHAFCKTAETVERALKALEALPIDALRLNINLRQAENEAEPRGLAVLFRAIELEHRAWRDWLKFWHEARWNPATGATTEDVEEYAYARTLREWIEAIVALIVDRADDAADGEEAHDRADLEGEITDLIETGTSEEKLAGARRLIEIAVLVGLVENAQGKLTAADSATRAVVIERPPWVKGIVRAASGVTVMRDTLGFGAVRGPGAANNDNAIPQILFDAFVGDAATKTRSTKERNDGGRDFYDAFRQGEMPEWVRFRCREYCADVLNWPDRQAWPFALSADADRRS